MRCYGKGDEVPLWDLCKVLDTPSTTGRIPLAPVSWGRWKMKFFFPAVAPPHICAQDILRHCLRHVKHSQCSQFPAENARKSTVGKPKAVRGLSHYTQSYLYSINGRSVVIKTSSAASLGYSLCGRTTSTAVRSIWKWLTSGRAGTNSSQPPFINDGCISLFSCQRDPRNVASRLLKFVSAKSFSVEIWVSSTVLICGLIVPQTAPRGCYTQLTSSAPLWGKQPSGTSPCSSRRTGKMIRLNRILPVFTFLKLVKIFSFTLKRVLLFPEVKWRILSVRFPNQ